MCAQMWRMGAGVKISGKVLMSCMDVPILLYNCFGHLMMDLLPPDEQEVLEMLDRDPP